MHPGAESTRDTIHEIRIIISSNGLLMENTMGIVMGGASYVLAQPYGPRFVLIIFLIPVLLTGAGFFWAVAKLVKFFFDVPFGEAYTTTIISWLIGMGVGFLLLRVAISMPDVLFLSVPFWSFPICLLVHASVFTWRLSVPFGKALLISLVMVVLSILLFAINALIVFIAFPPISSYLDRYRHLSGG